MKRLPCLLPRLCSALLLAALALRAADPYLGYVYPCGAQAGSAARLLIGGQNLQGVNDGLVTGDDVSVTKVTVVPNFPRADSRQRKYLLEWIKGIREGSPKQPPMPASTEGWRENAWWQKLDELDDMELRLVVKDLHTVPNALQASPSLRQLVIVDLKVGTKAATGERELRLFGRGGISAPKLFFVDAAPHVSEPDYRAPDDVPAATPRVAKIPSVLNGQILPGESDRFTVALQSGRDYSFVLSGRRLLPFIGDAVPGHFQAIMRLLDGAGREVAFADDEYFDPDPVLRFRCPAGGDYTLEVRDNLYRGREDFVYRIEVIPGQRPYLLAEQPWPKLPVLTEEQVRGQILEAATAQVVSAVIGQAGEGDRIRFMGQQGAVVVLDLAARRCASPLDAVMSISAPDGTTLAQVDDSAPPLNVGACLQQVDPYLLATLPADGVYEVRIRDTTGAGGSDYQYWLRLGPPQPAFRVYCTTSSLGQAQYGALTFVAERLDGFQGPITLSSSELIFTKGNIIPADQDKVKLQLRCPAFHRYSRPWPASITAEASCAGQTLQAEVIPCEECTQAFAYSHLLPVKSLYVNATQRNPPKQAGPEVKPRLVSPNKPNKP